MKKVLLLIGTVVGLSVFSQVGINTSDPKVTFDIQKNKTNLPEGFLPPRIAANDLQLKDSGYGIDQDGAIVYVTEPVNLATASLKTKTILTIGLYTYDAFYTHSNGSKGIWNKLQNPGLSNTFAAKGDTGLSLISLGVNLLGSEFRAINMNSSSMNIEIGSEKLNTSNQYVVSESGIYLINYSFKFGQGVTAQLLSSQQPSMAISKTNSSGTTLLDYNTFGGVQLLNLNSISLPIIGSVSLGVANVSLTQGTISYLYNLNEGDKLNFGVITGGLNLTLLGDTSTKISVVRVQ